MSKPIFNNDLNKNIKVFAEIDGGPRSGIGPKGESEIGKEGSTSLPDELEFANYDINKEVKIIIELDKIPNNSKGEGFVYAFGEKMGRAPHHIEVKRRGNDFTLIIHYKNAGSVTDVDPLVKHPG
ncbi:MAG: hypothetical protein RIC57_03685 [Balneola sp.]|jgi:hypothetical protein|tara:strand:- start:146914 stop:147288 length:375 start_codon:yes stop_codon:yes gene_type:complete